MKEYLRPTEIINWDNKDVLARAKELADDLQSPEDITRVCFEWVRDIIKHSYDFKLDPVTCSASKVLSAGTGYCYAKSHLLAALLRANSIPTGFCYQRLSRDDNGAPFCLHGLNAVFLPKTGWYRIDPRGNKEGVNAQFSPPAECLAYPVTLKGELDLPEIWTDPLPIVIDVLKKYRTYKDIWLNLPDIDTWIT